MLRLLLTLLLLVALCTIAPAQADGWTDKLGAALIVAPNDGVFLGGSLNYQLHEHLWLEAAVRRDGGGTAEGAGFSTDAQAVADLLERVIDLDLPGIPPRARVGGTIIGDRFVFIAYDLWF